MATKEKTITLEEMDPMEIYGVNNRILDRIKRYFPKLKIVARGSDIYLEGGEKDIKLFEERLNTLIEIRQRKRNLNEDDVDRLFDYENFPEVNQDDLSMPEDTYNIVYGNDGKVIKARTRNQKRLVDEYYKNDLLFALGPAGTGKTYTAIALAVRALKNKEVKKLILTRPAVEAGERLGFLPGDLKDKLDPYLQPLYDALRDMIHPKKLQALMEEGIIQIAPLAYMRGRTLDSAFVILDEAQNTSIGQLKMFLTRMGRDAKFIVTGDASQIDLPHKNDSGLLRGVELVKNIKGIAVINFGTEDIVRHPLVTKIVKAFDKEE
ncbi:MAG: PhoH family protein [Bacteroidales bacterium]|jgi:phosphate starvation-inducible PhoH-like protein|nr:PhoH family protein [Bacteroidales bacterium]MBO7321656.1 PhoH family protein [Bacteroidales bacterium]MBO7764260.1 PhoH family protein [Bacteroidales bacterium]MBQ2244125.1 PhoH family protein [Bacteroidales bacterium]